MVAGNSPSLLLTKGAAVRQRNLLPAFSARRSPADSTTRSFAAEVMPTFKAEAPAREARKAEELAPYIAAALKRKPWMKPLADHEIPVIKASVDRAQFARGAPPAGSQAAAKEPKVQTG